ncbi:hypothetical protein SMACR_03087 [Sordaria macrospora]|uniref:WGS project CABT00000000 data, contig 2.7 n=2 Tax=Sordaria macrospora TaxID=5147 RepID=F7VU96_SORMK|nr:uncharacterized protein SMAC_03087 [Sordaria macrospora k-hell]KAA8628078.1 hypothetical protein SMACR_03087 [Sordaria macrospora]KAH7632883.1 hypothetical protein B0T09DRAFT_81881 [Sordaria sp. MPI-SDFR-AT-0083]WPJ60654.1 hypothetical protein SMAC4_03087 [Sordaria macrospora]CCC09084.1 unnamed protein product [Sordaria macrospora k-hell]
MSRIFSSVLQAAFRPSAFLPKTATRSFSILPSLRPTFSSPSTTTIVFRAPQAITAPSASSSVTTGLDGEVLDVLSASSLVSSHPALSGLGSQIRCGPRPTMSGATRLVQKRRHGFLSRIKTKNGQKTLKRRLAKGRLRLSA